MYVIYHYKKTIAADNIVCTPCVNKQGLSIVPLGCNLDPELCIRQPLFVYTWGPIIISRVVFPNASKHHLKITKRSPKQIIEASPSIHIYIYTYIYRFFFLSCSLSLSLSIFIYIYTYIYIYV